MRLINQVRRDEILKRLPGRDTPKDRAGRAARKSAAVASQSPRTLQTVAEQIRERAGRAFDSARDASKEASESAKKATGRSDEPERIDQVKTVGSVVGAAVAGFASAFFLDPQNGKRRRHVAADKIAAFFRRRAGELRQTADYGAGKAKGAAAEAVSAVVPETEPANDQTLAERVQSQIFRPADAPKGDVNVSVEHGVVYLRGEVDDPSQIDELKQATQQVEGVTEVKALLHART